MRNDSHEFKPLLVEIEESPTNPLGRSIYWVILLIALAVVAWLFLAQVDVVVSAQGKIVPKGQVQIIQPLETGVVRRVLVNPGDHVDEGQILMELEPDTVVPEFESAAKRKDQLNLQAQRLSAQLDRRPFETSDSGPEAATQRLLYTATKNRLEQRLAAMQREQDRLTAQLESNTQQLTYTQKQVREVNDRYERMEPVKDLLARKEFDALVDKRLELMSRLEQQKGQHADLQHALEKLDAEQAALRHELDQNLLQELTQVEANMAETEGRQRELAFRAEKLLVKAPTSGVIDQRFVDTLGGVVTSAKPVFTLVPDNQPLVVEAKLQSRDSGYVETNMVAKLKIDTFEYQRYGTIDAKVTSVSSDSQTDERTQETYYEVTLEPKRDYLVVKGKREPLRTGMTLTADIKVGKRRIIEYFLYPVLKAMQDSVSLR